MVEEGTLAWELLYAEGMVLKREKKKKKEKRKEGYYILFRFSSLTGYYKILSVVPCAMQ